MLNHLNFIRKSLNLWRLSGVVSILGFVVIHPLFASDFHSPRTAALGGAGHGSPFLNDSIYLNPSFGSYNKVHSLTFNYLTYGGAMVPSPSGTGLSEYYGNNMNLSLLDSTPDELFQAGVGYTRRNDVNFVHIGASKSIVDRYGVGLGSKFIFPNNGRGSRIFDATFSASGFITDWFQTSLIIDNLLEKATAFGLNREFILGTKINVLQVFVVYLDPHWTPSVSDSHFGYEAGIEFPLMTDFFLRGGTFKNSIIPYQGTRGNGFGFGLGWMAPKLSLDYSFSRASYPIATHSHNFGASVFF